MVELGEGAVNMRHLSANCLAQDKALYSGHAVAAVAADSIHQAQEAIKLIEVDYEVLPPVLEVCAAMAPDAPLLHEDIRTDSMGAKGDEPTNVQEDLVRDGGR